MENRRRKNSNMKQVYLIRRIVAILLLVLIFSIIFTMCNKKNDTTTITESDQNTIVIQPEENVNTEDPATNNNATEAEQPVETTGQNYSLEEVLLTNEKQLQKEYEDRAVVTYDSANKAYFFTFNDDTKNIVLQRESDEGKEAFNTFWENFKFDLTKTSETLTETIEPGIELHVLNPVDNTSVLLLIQDGAEIFDQTSSN